MKNHVPYHRFLTYLARLDIDELRTLRAWLICRLYPNSPK